MRKFIIVVISFSSIILISFSLFFLMADGSTDAYYLKFTTPKQSSLVIGSSRAAQGIQPKSIKTVLNRDDIYNYAFSLQDSPYGEAYLESIKRKLQPNTKQGIFILEVNPWTIALDSNYYSKNNTFRETDNFVDNINFVTINPNIEYLSETYNKRYIDIFNDRDKVGLNETLFVEDDGWLKVTINLDGKSKIERIETKIIKYKEMLSYYTNASQYRIQNLIKTIDFLKQHGSVYLVRMPVIDEILEIENQLMLDFNNTIQDIALHTNVHYINMMYERNLYTYTDGNHLDVDSGKRFSIELSKIIKDYNQLNDHQK